MQHRMRIRHWNHAELRIAILSGLHGSRPWASLAALPRVIARINDLAADMILSPAAGRRCARGNVTEVGRHLIASGGIGCSGLPLRQFRPPEITEVTITPVRVVWPSASDSTGCRPRTRQSCRVSAWPSASDSTGCPPRTGGICLGRNFG